MKPISAFKIRISSTTSHIFDINTHSKILDVDNCKRSFLLEPITIEADPFLFVKDETLYLFYEYMKWGKKGVIKMVSTKDLKHWSKPVTVLEEECHLSYPFVFQDRESQTIYMIPECCQKKRKYGFTDVFLAI